MISSNCILKLFVISLVVSELILLIKLCNKKIPVINVIKKMLKLLSEKILKNVNIIVKHTVTEISIKNVPDLEPDSGIEIKIESKVRNKIRLETFLVNNQPNLL